MAGGNLIEAQPLDVDAEAQMMRAKSVHCRKIRIRDELLTIGVLCEVAKEIAALPAGEDFEGLLALWALPQVLAAGAEANLGKRAAGKVDLILDRGEVQVLAAVESGLDGIEERETAAVLIDVVVEQTGGENIGRCKIHLQAREIACSQCAAAVLSARQLADRIHIVEAVEAVIKPRPPFGDGSGDLDARRPFIDVEAACGAEAGKEIRRAEPPLVVAHAGLDIHRACRTAILIGGVAGAVQVH